MRKHAGCSRCKEYYMNGNFKSSDYVICEECGRLLVGLRKEREESCKQKVLPYVLMMGEDVNLLSRLRRAIYDPRDYFSYQDINEVVFGSNGVSKIGSVDGEVATIHDLTEIDPDDPTIFSMLSDEPPTLLLVVLDYSKNHDLKKYSEFIKNYTCLMRLVSIFKHPIVVVLDNVDELTPSDVKNPELYPAEKIKAIDEIAEYYRKSFADSGAEIEGVIPVSSYVKWEIKNNKTEGVTADDLNMAVDGRYNTERLRSIIEESGYREERIREGEKI